MSPCDLGYETFNLWHSEVTLKNWQFFCAPFLKFLFHNLLEARPGFCNVFPMQLQSDNSFDWSFCKVFFMNK